MRRPKNVAGRVGVATAAVAAAMLGVIGSADAAVPSAGGSTFQAAGPSDCLTYYNTEITFVAWCREGSGMVRASTMCAVDWWPDYRRYGEWVSVGNASIAQCDNWDEEAYGGRYSTR
jgi:hypothetical protein